MLTEAFEPFQVSKNETWATCRGTGVISLIVGLGAYCGSLTLFQMGASWRPDFIDRTGRLKAILRFDSIAELCIDQSERFAVNFLNEWRLDFFRDCEIRE